MFPDDVIYVWQIGVESCHKWDHIKFLFFNKSPEVVPPLAF